MHKNTSDWSCQFAGPTEVSTGTEIPEGCEKVELTFSNGTITLYLVDVDGNSVGAEDLANFNMHYWDITGVKNSDWPGVALSNLPDFSAGTFNADSTGMIINWTGGQTADIKGAFAVNKTYVVKLAKSPATPEITEITLPEAADAE